MSGRRGTAVHQAGHEGLETRQVEEAVLHFDDEVVLPSPGGFDALFVAQFAGAAVVNGLAPLELFDGTVYGGHCLLLCI